MSNLFLSRNISKRYVDEQPFFVKLLATLRPVSTHLNSWMLFWCMSSLNIPISICSLLFSTAVVECTLSTRDLLSLSTERGNRGRPSMLHNKEFKAIAASDASTAARHSAARVLFTTRFILLLCHARRL